MRRGTLNASVRNTEGICVRCSGEREHEIRLEAARVRGLISKALITASHSDRFLFCCTRSSTRPRHDTMISSPSSKSWPPCRNLSHDQMPCVTGMVSASTAMMTRRIRLRQAAERNLAKNACARSRASMASWVTLVVRFYPGAIGGLQTWKAVSPRHERGDTRIFRSSTVSGCRSGTAGRRGCRSRSPCCPSAARPSRSRVPLHSACR